MKKIIMLCLVAMMCWFGSASAAYVDNGDGTITDTTTGLMWQKATAPGTYTWEQAITYCESLTLPAGGYSDWRLPNRNELQSIVDYTRYSPSIDTVAFPGTVASYYWSSTTYAYSTYFAWGVFFNGGYVDSYYKHSYFYVRAVRGGPCGSFDDLDGDGILDDGDNNTLAGDTPCTGGNMINCDDNCPNTPNGQNSGTCVKTISGVIAGTGVTCVDDSGCGAGETCQMEQGDSNSNGIGDVCECYADCDNSGQVNVFDIIILKNEYNRNDCSTTACDADCNDDGNVNTFDLIIMKNQYNRSGCPVVQ